MKKLFFGAKIFSCLRKGKANKRLEQRIRNISQYIVETFHDYACTTASKPSFKSKAKEHTLCLIRQMDL